MKKKVRVNSLPKAQAGMQPPMVLTPEQKAIWIKNQGIWGNTSQGIKPVTSYETIDAKVFKPITPQMMGIGVPKTKAEWEKQNGPFNLTGDFFKPKKDFGIPTYDPSIPGARMSQDMRNQEQTLREGEVSTSTPKSILNAQGINNQVINSINGDKTANKKGNPYLAQMWLAGTDIIKGLANQIENRFAKNDLREQLVSDNLTTPREESISGNRGDYNFDEFGFGPSFRPDDYIYGMYNKIAQMGGEMKRKVKITSLPQAAYGGSQNQSAVNQLYGNSAYMVNKFSGLEKESEEPNYNQTLGPDPRSMSVLEAEKGETLIRKGTNSAIPEFFKIGGKRHSQGGTPLSGDKATPDSFIYSDTKAMKIKDPAILESFGFAAKKGGYTPAQISKKFDLNSKELRDGLYSKNDPLRKATAVMMADNYISNLGKLALVQESQKGFPQGIPQIAMPYMDKVGLDPAQFLPPSPEEGMMMARYGGIPKAQVGQSVYSNSSNQTLSDDALNTLGLPKGTWDRFRLTGSVAYPTQQQRVAYTKQSNPYNPLNWAGNLNYLVTGDPSYNPVLDPLNYLAVSKFAKPIAQSTAKILGPAGESISNMLKPVKNWYKDLNIAGPMSMVLDAAPAVAVLSTAAYRALSPEEKVEYLKTATPEQINQIVEDTMSNSKDSQDSALLIEAAKSNPNIDVARIPEVTIKAKPKVNATDKPQTQRIPLSIDDLLNERVNSMLDEKEYGGELEQYQTAGQVTGEKEYVEVVTLPDGSKGKRITKGNTVSIVDASGKELGSKTIESNYRTINPTRLAELEKRGIKLTVPKRYEGKEWSMTPGRQGGREGSGTFGTEDWYAGENKDDFANRQARFLRFYPQYNPKKKEDNKLFQNWYNNDIYDQSIRAGLSEAEAKKNVDEFGFIEGSKDPNALDSMFGHYTWSRPTINIDRIPPPETPRDEIPPGELIPPPPKRPPIGFYPQDVLNVAAAVGDLASINSYYPRKSMIIPEPMEPTFYDPNRELANNAEMANIAAANLAQFTGPQAFNARFSDVQGKGLANAANILGRYNNLNVGVANQFEQANKQLVNEANFRNAFLADDFYNKTITTRQQTDNARRAGRRQVVDYFNAGLDNRFLTDQMNSLYPNYFVEPSRLKTYYTPNRQITAKQKGQDMMDYLESTGIPFDYTNPAVQAALLRGIMGDVNVDERGDIYAAQAGLAKKRGKTS